MVTLYPYTLWAQETDPLTKTSKGDAVRPNQVWQEKTACRDEQNTAGKPITLADSSTVVPSAIVYLPLTAPLLEQGTEIEVRDANGVRLQGTVKRFARELLHCRLWV